MENQNATGEVVSNPVAMLASARVDLVETITNILKSTDPDTIEKGIASVREKREELIKLRGKVKDAADALYVLHGEVDAVCVDVFKALTGRDGSSFGNLKAHADANPKQLAPSTRNQDAEEARKVRETLRGVILDYVKEKGEVSRSALFEYCAKKDAENYTESAINLSIMFLKEMGDLFSTGSGQKSKLTCINPKAPKVKRAK